MDFDDQTEAFDEIIAYAPGAFSLTTDEGSRPLMGEWVTGNFFSALGITPALGRGFRPEETVIGQAERVVVLGYGFWTQEFGRDSSACGGGDPARRAAVHRGGCGA